MSTSTSTSRIKSADIKPGDIIKFEYGDYDNWVTVRIDEIHINFDPKVTYYPQKLIWHYLSDESKEPQRDCRAEKLGNNPQTNKCPYRQFTSYSKSNDLVEKLN